MHKELIHALEKSMDKLTPKQREIIVRVYLNGENEYLAHNRMDMTREAFVAQLENALQLLARDLTSHE